MSLLIYFLNHFDFKICAFCSTLQSVPLLSHLWLIFFQYHLAYIKLEFSCTFRSIGKNDYWGTWKSMGTASKSIAYNNKKISFHFVNCKTLHNNQNTFWGSKIFEFFQYPLLTHPFHCQNHLTILLERYLFHWSKISFLGNKNGWYSLPFNEDKKF